LRTFKGMFVTFEGVDGSGKSTQIAVLRQSLENRGIEVVVIREPGGTLIGEKIRSILLDRANDGMTSGTELFLYEAARAQIVHDVILPALLAGKAVICDRFFDSTVAYQGYGRGLDLVSIHLLNDLAAEGLQPDLTYYLDLPVKAAIERMHVREGEQDRIEQEGFAFMERVRTGYLALAAEHKRIITLDAMAPVMELADHIERTFWEVCNT
jgi:dTMP kinase